MARARDFWIAPTHAADTFASLALSLSAAIWFLDIKRFSSMGESSAGSKTLH